MAKFEVGDRVRLPGGPDVVQVLKVGTCEDGKECPLGGEIFWFKDPHGLGDDRAHSSRFEKVS